MFFWFQNYFSFGNKGIDLFKKLKKHSHGFITPSNSNTFLIPKTKSMFLCISDTKAYTSNLWQCICNIIEIMKSMFTCCLFPTWILWIFEANLGSVTWGMMIKHHNIKMLCYAYVTFNNDMGTWIYGDVSVWHHRKHTIEKGFMTIVYHRECWSQADHICITLSASGNYMLIYSLIKV